MWEQCVDIIRDEINFQEMSTWISPLQARVDGQRLCVFAPNQFVMQRAEEYFGSRLLEICRGISDGTVEEIVFRVGEARVNDTVEASPPENSETETGDAAGQRGAANLSPQQTFETYVEGKSNMMARAAALQIGQNPGSTYNPLFIYGGVGLGKTHLMQAVGNVLLDANPDARVLYIPSEQFVNEMIKALRHNRIDSFKKTYRSLNALLIDDVQFFAGKERSQEELFHTFNALFESRQQIVLSCDRFPKEVAGLEDRLRSRFGWGLTVAIDPPDLETRVAILHSKAGQNAVTLPDDVAFFVARHIRSSIRELEGAFHQLIAHMRFTGRPITLEMARDVLRDHLAAQDKQVSIANIQKTVAEYYKLRAADLVSAKRTRSIARPRQIAMSLARELTRHSLNEIGEAFGGRDHTTVMHASRKIEGLRESDATVEEDYRNLLRMLTS